MDSSFPAFGRSTKVSIFSALQLYTVAGLRQPPAGCIARISAIVGVGVFHTYSSSVASYAMNYSFMVIVIVLVTDTVISTRQGWNTSDDAQKNTD